MDIKKYLTSLLLSDKIRVSLTGQELFAILNIINAPDPDEKKESPSGVSQ